MPRKSVANELARLMKDLLAERAGHLDAIARIDATFAQLGITADAGHSRPGRPSATSNGPAAPKRRKGARRRGRFEQTGEESVLGFITKQKQATSAQVNQHWRGEGRQGKANNTLTKLVQDGKLKRVSVAGERGGVYKPA